MATRQKRKEEEAQKQREIAEAEEFLDERRVIDGKERFWSAESQVMLRTLAVEENVANSQDPKTKKKWNPKYPVDAKAELERREAVEKEEEEKRKVEEEKRTKEEEEKRKREEERKKLRRPGRPLLEGHGTGARRPLLKNTEETNAELERMEAVEKEEEEMRKREERKKKLRRPPRKPENLEAGSRILLPAPRRPLLKSTNTECPGKKEIVGPFDFPPSGSESEEENRREVSPFEVYTPSESDAVEDEV